MFDEYWLANCTSMLDMDYHLLECTEALCQEYTNSTKVDILEQVVEECKAGFEIGSSSNKNCFNCDHRFSVIILINFISNPGLRICWKTTENCASGGSSATSKTVTDSVTKTKHSNSSSFANLSKTTRAGGAAARISA